MVREQQMEKRDRKLELAAEEIGLAEKLAVYGAADAAVTVVGWGSTKGAVLEAIEALAREGIGVRLVQVRLLWPFPGAELEELLCGDRAAGPVVTVELNYSGQFARLLAGQTGVRPAHQILKYNRPAVHGRRAAATAAAHRRRRRGGQDGRPQSLGVARTWQPQPWTADRRSSSSGSTTPTTGARAGGDFGILGALQQTLAGMGLRPHEVVLVGGIGCSGKAQYYVNCYGVHTLHGRPLPFATGIKLANPELTVIIVAGDGDGLGIGAGHFVNAGRRNVDMTYLLFNNEVYGLTQGQGAPTLQLGLQTKSLAEPNIQESVNGPSLAYASGFTWIGRGYSFDVRHLVQMITRAVEHPGLSFLDIVQPCPTLQRPARQGVVRWRGHRDRRLALLRPGGDRLRRPHPRGHGRRRLPRQGGRLLDEGAGVGGPHSGRGAPGEAGGELLRRPASAAGSTPTARSRRRRA